MEWIKCSDRLPEESGRYLCYVKCFEDSEYCDGWYYSIEFSNYDKKVINTEYYDNMIVHKLSEKMNFDINTDGYISKEVTHWFKVKEPKED